MDVTRSLKINTRSNFEVSTRPKMIAANINMFLAWAVQEIMCLCGEPATIVHGTKGYCCRDCAKD